MSDKTMYETPANCWTITHPEMGGPLEVVAASAYDALVEEVEQLNAAIEWEVAVCNASKERHAVLTLELADLRRVNEGMREALQYIAERAEGCICTSETDARDALSYYERRVEGENVSSK